MSHTNKTTHYNLPQFIGTDKPGWLTDVNQGYQDIDEAIYQADSAAQGAQVTADSANSAIQTVNADLQTAKTQLDTTTTVANQAQATNVTQGQQIATNATGITNINARLGNKDISTIGDGTITGAIDAIKQGSGGGELADDVTQAGTSAVKSSGIYDFVNNRTGGLTFAQDARGDWGYKVGGADPVIPFKRDVTPDIIALVNVVQCFGSPKTCKLYILHYTSATYEDDDFIITKGASGSIVITFKNAGTYLIATTTNAGDTVPYDLLKSNAVSAAKTAGETTTVAANEGVAVWKA